MVYEATPHLVSFDAERAVERARAVAGDGLLAVGVWTRHDYEILHLDDASEAAFDDPDRDLEALADDLHGYENLHFLEGDLFADMLPTAESVSAFATFTDVGIITRFVTDDREGLHVSTDREVDLTRLVLELEPVVLGE